MIGKRIHADGSPASGFEVIFEEYDLTRCTQSYEIIYLGKVKIGDLEHTATSVEAPRKSLIPASGKVHLRTCYRDSRFETKQPLMLNRDRGGALN
jgi:hypothetical protein